MSSINLADCVDADLRNLASKEQLSFLNEHKDQWRSELCVLKRKAETQMTSYRARVFSIHAQLMRAEITQSEYLIKLDAEKVWKTGANRFIQEIESKLAVIKYDSNSEQD